MADISLITIEQAFRQLRIEVDEGEAITDHEDHDSVELYAQTATGVVLDYIKDRENEHGWTAEDCPPPVRASILIVLSDLWEHRAGSAADDVFLSKAVRELLHRHRDPALA